MTYSVVSGGQTIAANLDGDTAASLVMQAEPGASVRQGLVELYRRGEWRSATASLLRSRSGWADHPHPCSIYGVVSWRYGLRPSYRIWRCLKWVAELLVRMEGY